jgi:hypothetical protein
LIIFRKKDQEGRWKKRRKEKGRRMKDHGLGGRKWKEGDSRKEEARTRREGIRKIESARKRNEGDRWKVRKTKEWEMRRKKGHRDRKRIIKKQQGLK